jgi:ribosome-associated toxin RatA of RatAB toxin-antitoxin module
MRLTTIILGLLLLALIWIPGAARADTTFTAEEQATLDRGDVVRRPLGEDSNSEGYLGGTSYALIHAEPDVVWRAMQDFSAFPDIFPQTLATEIISDRGNRKVVKMTQGTSLVTISFYVLYRLDEEARKISWEMIQDQPHDLEDTRGYWQVEAHGEGRSLVTYVNVINIGQGAVLALFSRAVESGLLALPGNLRIWIEGPNGSRYRSDGAATATTQ